MFPHGSLPSKASRPIQRIVVQLHPIAAAVVSRSAAVGRADCCSGLLSTDPRCLWIKTRSVTSQSWLRCAAAGCGWGETARVTSLMRMVKVEELLLWRASGWVKAQWTGRKYIINCLVVHTVSLVNCTSVVFDLQAWKMSNYTSWFCDK